MTSIARNGMTSKKNCVTSFPLYPLICFQSLPKATFWKLAGPPAARDPAPKRNASPRRLPSRHPAAVELADPCPCAVFWPTAEVGTERLSASFVP